MDGAAPISNPLTGSRIGPLLVYRVLALLGVVIILGFHVVMGVSTADEVILSERMLLAGVLVAFFGGTFVSRWVQRHVRGLFEAILYGVGLWTVHNAMTLSFDADQTLALLIGIFTMSVVFRTSWGLLAFHGVMAVAVFVGMQLSPPEHMDPLLISGTQTTMALVSWLAARARDHAIAGVQKLSLVASRVHNGVAITDAEGRVEWVNAGFSRMSGLSREQAVGRPMADLFPQSRCQAELALLRDAFREQRALSQLTLVHTPPGEPDRYVALDLTPIREAADPVARFIAIETDISQARAQADRLVEERLETEEVLRDTERQLLQAQKMEAVGRLAGGVAHDFNNLLLVVLGHAELLMFRASDHATRKRLEAIVSAAERGAQLTRQLLAFSRHQLCEPRVIALDEAIESIGTLLARLVGEHIELRILPQAPGLHVFMDEGELTQVVLNLAVNARDAMPEGGHLTVETHPTTLSPSDEPEGDAAREAVGIRVTDDGEGMDEDLQGRIFEPFFTTKDPGRGTGLGLSTVYGIVTRNDGLIEVDSARGEGTSFHIRLPVVHRQPDPATVAEEGSFEGSETVLVVEDDENVRDVLAAVLEDAGHHVLTAPDVPGSHRVIEERAGEIRLLVTDMVLPGGTGRQVAEHLVERNPEAAIICLSGYTPDSLPDLKGLEDRCEYLQKPFSSTRFLAMARRLLDKGVVG